MDFNILDILQYIADAQIIVSLKTESVFALVSNLSLLTAFHAF